MSKRKKPKENLWGERLLSVLKEKKITVRKAATYAGVAPSVIDSWTSSSSPSDLRAVKRLCSRLDVSFSWVLTGELDKGERQVTLSEFYEQVPHADFIARVRIDRLVPRKRHGNDDEFGND